ncbi:EamA family transporter [Brevundimonas sp.]|uniref:EamA family transporter n=1 Tax=Brevundimonas sp. TaxID=1871086 RepID=UPI0025C5A4DA|nr:EamA family transporter [Brevundimonas sp.]
MTIWSRENADGPISRRLALFTLFLGLPLLGLGYQVASKFTAMALGDKPFGMDWIVAALSQPWGPTLLVIEVLSLVAWMVVLSEIKLSAAFPMLALGYVLVMVTGWLVFHEQLHWLQAVGGVAIMGGVWMIGREHK